MKKYKCFLEILLTFILSLQSCKGDKVDFISVDLSKVQVDILFVSESPGIQKIFAVQDTTFEDVVDVIYSYETNGILDPTWSADGRKFAFTDISVMTSSGYPYHSNISIMNMDSVGTDNVIVPVTYSEFGFDTNGIAFKTLNLRPDWSLNTNQMVFISNRDSIFNVYLTGITDSLFGDSTLLKLTDESDKIDINCFPSFSPDGSKILYTSGKSGNKEIWVMNSDGSNKQRLTYTGSNINSRPRFSPLNDRISFFSNMWINGNDSLQIYTMDINGTDLDTITRSGNNYDPAWSPDGNEIIFAKKVGSPPHVKGYIYIIGKNGQNERKLIKGDSKADYPIWRP